MLILKKNGTHQSFDEKKIFDIITLRSGGLPGVHPQRVFDEFIKNIAEGISTRDLEKVLILSASSLSEINLDYDKLATRLFLQKIYKEVMGTTKSQEQRISLHKKIFSESITSNPRYDSRLSDYNLEFLSQHLDLSRDEKFNFIGITNLYEKLLSRDEEGNVKETPQIFFMRIAMGLCLLEENKEDRVLELYEIYSQHQGISSTPTLHYSGMKQAQLSSCGGGVIDDTTESIFAGATDSFKLGKWSYGIGTSVSKLRANGSPVKSTGIESSGIIPFLRVYNDVTVATNRSGRKRGAMQVTLENWHYETEEFIKLRRNSGDERMRTHDLSTALFISDEFMKRVMRDEMWMLIDPKEARDNGYDLTELYGREFSHAYQELEKLAKAGGIRIHKFVKAKDLWKAHLLSLFETGHPWISFKDVMNVRNPNLNTGMIYSTNLCTEIAINSTVNPDGTGDYFNCFLASVNLSEMYDQENQFNAEKLAHTVSVLVRSLDNANDLNFYPIEGARNGAMKYRALGVGMMGFQDLLFKNRIPYDSSEALDLLDRITEVWSYSAINASADLAREKGSYPQFPGSLWNQGILPLDTLKILEEERGLPNPVDMTSRLDWGSLREKVKGGMRNGYLMACAPNASTSLYLGVYPALESQFANIYAKENMLGKFAVLNQYLIEDLNKKFGNSENIIQELKANGGNLVKSGITDKELLSLYRSAFEVDPMAQVNQASVMAKWIDQSHSRNIFLEGTSGKMLNDIYFQGWLRGVKTFYYLRSKAISSIEKSTV